MRTTQPYQDNRTDRPGRPSLLARLRAMSPARGLGLAEAIGVAERQATTLLEASKISSAPVPLSLLSDLPHIVLGVEHQLPTSGVSFWDGDNWQLKANAEEHATRQRFSLAHEYKHVIDHPNRDLLYPSHAIRERVADHFAACLLMPRVLITRAWCAGEQDVAQLAELFSVSPLAMERRLRELGHLDRPLIRRYSCARGLPNSRRFAIAGQSTSTSSGATP